MVKLRGALAFSIVIGIIGAIIGLYIGSCIEHQWFEREAVRAGHAKYDETTGKWEWKPK